MPKARSRNIYLSALAAYIVGFALFFAGGATTSTTTNALGNTTATVTGVNNPVLFYIGLALIILGGIAALVAWIGSLIKVAQLQRWGWFVGMLLFSGIGMLIYIFAGPQTPRKAA